MNAEKRELLEGGYTIQEFPEKSRLSCFLYQCDPRCDVNELGLSLRVEDQYLGYLPIRVDVLLCKWLKISKYFTVPTGYNFAASLFLQPYWDFTKCLVALEESHAVLKTIRFMDPDYTIAPNDGLVFETKSRIFCWVVLPDQLPFVFIQTDEDKELVASDIECSIPFKLVPTSDSHIKLLIISNILNSYKDCARLFREYLKRPHNPVWYTQNRFKFFLRFNTFQVLCWIDNSLNSTRHANFHDCNFETDLVTAIMSGKIGSTIS